MADVTITGLSDLAPASNTYIPLSNGTTTGRALTNNLPGLTPVGGIIMWSGSIAAIPAGWALCNGLNGTPNLQDRFIVGAGSSYAVNGTGGSATASGSTNATALSIAQMPAHSHAVTDPGHSHSLSQPFGRYGSNGLNPYVNSPNFVTETIIATQSQTGITIAAAGGGAGHSHTISSIGTIPPYYALAYIMRTS